MKDLFKLNLQMFAEEEEDLILEDEYPLDEEDEGEELQAEETEELEEEPEEDGDEYDPKTRAIIRVKKERAELKRQNEELQKKLEEIEFEKQKSQRIIELTKTGVTPEEATKKATDEIELNQLRLQLAKMELSNLENKYPGISLYAKDLIQDKAKLPEFSFEQLYQAKYAKKSQYDEKTRLEQELAYMNKEAREKSLETSNAKAQKQVTLSQRDERIYRELKRNMPGLTRKRFKELNEMDSLE